MANLIRLKRASGSDPAASDLVSGEPAVRTDTGELFFKKDDGSVAKVSGAGGGPDFKYLALRNAANNGAASYPNADFTLVTSGTTTALTPTAANTLLVSVNGVIQKPNTGTSTPSSGFALSGSTIKFGGNISAAPDFILYQESGGIGEPSDETVGEDKLKVSNSPINGYFLSAQSGNTGGLTWAAPVATSCTGNSATATALATARAINGVNFDGTAAITVTAAAGTLSGNTLNSSVTASSLTSLGDLTSLTVTGDLVVDTNTLKVDSSNNRVGIGTTSPAQKLHVQSSGDTIVRITSADGNAAFLDLGDVSDPDGGRIHYDSGSNLVFNTASAERMRITSSGNVGIGTTSPSQPLHVLSTTNPAILARNDSGGTGIRMQTHNGSACSLSFSDTDAHNQGLIMYHHADDRMQFNTAGSERMRIDSSGNVGIGETSMDALLVIKGNSDASTTPSIRLKDGTDTREAWISNSAGDLVLANGGNDNTPHCKLVMFDGNVMQFNTSNTERMRIDSSGRVGIGTTSPTHKFQVADSNTAIGFSRDGQSPQIIFDANTVTTCGIISLHESFGGGEMKFFTKDTGGTSRERLRLLTSGGVTFNGDTAAANALDDYEEGTYTPVITGDSGTATASTTGGCYTKIGRFVSVNIGMTLSSRGSISGSVYVSLPFTVGDRLSGTSLESNGSCVFFLNLATASSFLGLNSIQGAAKARFGGVESKQVTSSTTISSGDITDSFSFRATISYFI